MLNYYRANWNIKQLLLMNEDQRSTLITKFPKIIADTLLIWGEQDLALDISLSTNTGKYISGNFTKEYISDVGHFVHIESSERVNELILAHIK